jgi:EAL domain-containing protein (putative c-di-GMP-specific phosphodiesterase class I)
MNLKSVKAVLLGFSAVLLIFIFLLVSNNFYRAIRISEKENTLIHCLDRTSFLLEILRNLQIYIRDLEKIPFEVSINLSYEDLTAETTFNSIVNFLRNLKPKKELQVEFTNRLVFEIVETEDIENYKYLQRFVKLVKPLGCKLAIDDFGTGYSNLKRLIDFKVDYLKIDGSIIKSVKTDKSSISLIKSIISFSKALGIKTIAEFVSDEEIFKIVRDLGVDYSQGYYFGKPEPKEEILRKYVI